MKRWPFSPLITLLIMIPLVSFYSFALDLYIPLLPAIQQEMDASRVVMQYTNSLFMFFCGLGQLVFGPISDRYGRRPVLLVSCQILFLANVVCAFSPSVEFLLLGRILQAIGACGCYLVAFATIRDIYPDANKSAEMFSYLNIANSLSAIFAPSIGSFIGSMMSWHAIFYAQMITSAATTTYCLLAFYETTSTKDPKPLNFRKIGQNYWAIFTHINYQVYTLPAACGMGSFFAFYSVSPYIYQEVLGFSPLAFSLLYGTCGMTFFVGSYLCGLCVARYGILSALTVGLAIHILGCLGVLACTSFFLALPAHLFHLCIILIILGASFMVGAGIGGTMAPFASMAGAAFAMISCYKFMLSEVMGDWVVFFYDDTPLSLGLILLVVNLLSWIVLLFNKHKLILKNPSQTTVMVQKMDETTDHIL